MGMKALLLLFLSTVLPKLAAESLSTINVEPTHYKVEIEINTERRSLAGEVCIVVLCNTDTGEIKLHGKQKYGIRLKENIEIKHFSKNPRKIEVINKDYDKGNGVLTIQTTKLEPKEKYVMCIPFEGDITEESNYIIWEGVENSKKKYIIATNFMKQSAFPCFDEPSLRATFELQLTIKATETSYSNSPRSRIKKPGREGWVVDTYSVTNKLPPSQISFVITNLEFWSYDYRFFSEWSAKFNYRPAVHDELGLNSKLFGSMVRTKYLLLGPIFSFPKVEFIIIPTDKHINTFTWGLVLIRERDFTKTSEEERMYKMFVRMASQWFGGMVSPDCWESQWISPALAAYVAYLQMPKQTYVYNLPSLLWQDTGDDLDKNIKYGLDPFQNVKVSVEKGLMFLRMVQSVLGKKEFVKAIQDIIKTYKNKPAGMDQLWDIFDDRSKGKPKGLKLRDVMKTWTEQLGYPLVTVVNKGNGNFEITQEPLQRLEDRLKTDGVKTDSVRKECWWIPVTYTTARKTNFRLQSPSPNNWLGCGSRDVLSVNTKVREGDWVVFNVFYAGLYRVKYDFKTWELIINGLEKDLEVFPPFARAQLVNDALALPWLGYVDYNYAFKLLTYLKQEVDSLVWKVFFLGAFNLKEMLKASPETNQKFLAYVSPIVEAAIRSKYGDEQFTLFNSLDKQSGLSLLQVDFLFYSWSCIVLRFESCTQQAINKFDQWQSNGRISVNSSGFKKSLFMAVLCTVLQEQKENEKSWNDRFQFFLTFLKGDFGGSDYRLMFTNVLSCTTNKNNINSLLDWTASINDDPATKEEKLSAFLSLARGTHSFTPVLEYFYTHADEIQSFYDSREDVLAKIVYVLSSKMTLDQVDKMKTFISERPYLNRKNILQSLKDAESRTKVKIKWMEENDMKIRNVLDSYLTS